jgi:hypothetical protein
MKSANGYYQSLFFLPPMAGLLRHAICSLQCSEFYSALVKINSSSARLVNKNHQAGKSNIQITEIIVRYFFNAFKNLKHL